MAISYASVRRAEVAGPGPFSREASTNACRVTTPEVMPNLLAAVPFLAPSQRSIPGKLYPTSF